jgi:lysophospholipase L1-like esterase
MSGINDGITSNTFALKSYNDYIAILQTLRNANVEPVVTLVLYRENEKYKKEIDEFNNKVFAYCNSNNITVIDLNTVLCNESGLRKDYSKDGVHINRDAYRIWGREINRVLNEKKYL